MSRSRMTASRVWARFSARPDIALVDVGLHGMGCYEVARAVRQGALVDLAQATNRGKHGGFACICGRCLMNELDDLPIRLRANGFAIELSSVSRDGAREIRQGHGGFSSSLRSWIGSFATLPRQITNALRSFQIIGRVVPHRLTATHARTTSVQAPIDFPSTRREFLAI